MGSATGEVLVVGSSSIDISISLQQIPRPGETVMGLSDEHGLGGKGANQAHAAARAGAPTAFLGAVGEVESGTLIRDALTGSGVDVSATRVVPGESGTAYIMVETTGENAIVVVPAANHRLVDLTDAEQARIAAADVVLMQLEIPMATVTAAAAVAHAAGRTVALNAAPYAELPPELLASLDLLIVNEHEAAGLTGSEGSPAELADLLLRQVPQVVITLGGEGSIYLSAETGIITTAAPKVDVVDTTGAGDAFCGAFVAAVVEGQAPAEALRFAGTAGALAVQKAGAVASIPSRAAIDAALSTYFPA